MKELAFSLIKNAENEEKLVKREQDVILVWILILRRRFSFLGFVPRWLGGTESSRKLKHVR